MFWIGGNSGLELGAVAGDPEDEDGMADWPAAGVELHAARRINHAAPRFGKDDLIIKPSA